MSLVSSEPEGFSQLTVVEAAAVLGVSDRRVRALITAGKLKARETVHGYDVDAASVAAYNVIRDPRGGRPRKHKPEA